MFPVHRCPLTLLLWGQPVWKQPHGRKEGSLQHQRVNLDPKSEPKQEENTKGLLLLLCSLDIQDIVQTPRMEHLDTAVHKNYPLLLHPLGQ